MSSGLKNNGFISLASLFPVFLSRDNPSSWHSDYQIGQLSPVFQNYSLIKLTEVYIFTQMDWLLRCIYSRTSACTASPLLSCGRVLLVSYIQGDDISFFLRNMATARQNSDARWEGSLPDKLFVVALFFLSILSMCILSWFCLRVFHRVPSPVRVKKMAEEWVCNSLGDLNDIAA